MTAAERRAIIAALLARGERDVSVPGSRTLTFTRHYHGMRAADGSLRPCRPDAAFRWYICGRAKLWGGGAGREPIQAAPWVVSALIEEGARDPTARPVAGHHHEEIAMPADDQIALAERAERYETALRAIASLRVDDATNHQQLSALMIAIARTTLDMERS